MAKPKTGQGGGRSKPATENKGGLASRRLAMDALIRIESGGAYANLVLPDMLATSTLSPEDRRFVTQLVYGTTRMKRACDHLVDRFVLGDVDATVRAALRLGAYQLVFLETPAHAAVDATVGAVKGRGRSVVNAVLRRVAQAPVEYPDEGTRLSYPDWIIARLSDALGAESALQALEAMNRPAETSARDDGYVQDPASQMVVEAVAAEPDELVVDLCAAPGGKATGIAASGARVIASDLRQNRVKLIARNVAELGSTVEAVVADGRFPAVRRGVADRVLIDAPCSGFGSFRRRADARWRIDPKAPARLAELQVDLVIAGIELLKPGGVLTYSVCTFGDTEGSQVMEAVSKRCAVERLPTPEGAWLELHGMAVLLPTDTDGMMLAQVRR